MKPLSKVILVISFLLLTATCLLSTANAAVPHLINYQGRLTDSSGVPLNGSYQLTFRIYDAETAGNLLWQETHTGVVISKGIFSLLLGSVTDLNIPFDNQYYLEIKVVDEVMSPRQRIASSVKWGQSDFLGLPLIKKNHSDPIYPVKFIGGVIGGVGGGFGVEYHGVEYSR